MKKTVSILLPAGQGPVPTTRNHLEPHRRINLVESQIVKFRNIVTAGTGQVILGAGLDLHAAKRRLAEGHPWIHDDVGVPHIGLQNRRRLIVPILDRSVEPLCLPFRGRLAGVKLDSGRLPTSVSPWDRSSQVSLMPGPLTFLEGRALLP